MRWFLLTATIIAASPAAAQIDGTKPATSATTSSATADRAALADKLAALVENGNPEAAYHLGMMRDLGIGGPKDAIAAINLFRLAAKGGDPLGAHALGDAYAKGVPGVIEPDSDQAFAYKLTAAEAGYALAQHDVARTYFDKGEIDAALEWLTRAASQGQSDALRALASLYNSDAISKDGARTYAYYSLYLRRIAAPTEKQQVFLRDFLTRISAADKARGDAILASFTIAQTAITQRAQNGLRAASALVADTGKATQDPPGR